MKTVFKRPFDRFHRFAAECAERKGVSSDSRALDRLVDEIIDPPVSIKLLIARYNAIARLQEDPDSNTYNALPFASAA